ncbi:MAG: hypothetical protein K8I00_11815, partial [Candidatus Omnitrophica bacterium]|nr:hypothetical protein [Candidatus Omnitrophota bacterium]
FAIHVESNLDLNQFASQTGLVAFASIPPNANDMKSKVDLGMDRVLDQAAEVLGLSMQDFECRVEVFPTDVALKKKLDDLFGIKKGDRAVYFHREYPAFYYHATNTIYLSLESASLGVIGHEMTHALISKYFVVPPTERIQEILAGYVEFSLKKSQPQ